MALTQLAPPYPIFTDKSGSPLDAGYLYFGEVNKNPETNPITVYYDRGFTQPVAQPVRTSNGYIMRNGSPALIYADSQFSVTVRNKQNELVIYSPVGFGVMPGVPFAVFENAARDVAALLADTQFTYAAGVPNTVQVAAGDILRTLTEGFAYEVAASGAADEDVTTAGGVKLYIVPSAAGCDVKAAGAVGDGVTDDTAAFNIAKSVTGVIVIPPGTYRTSISVRTPYSGSGTVQTLAGAVNTAFVRVGEGDTDKRLRPLGGVIRNEWDGPAKTVTGATQANPVVITCVAHGFTNGRIVQLLSLGGMVEVNNNFYTVANATTDTFELLDENGANVDGTGFSAYTSGGTARQTTGWFFLDDVGHEPNGFSDIVTLGFGSGPKRTIRMNYNFTATKVGTFSVTNDETLAQDKISAGCSVNADHALMNIYQDLLGTVNHATLQVSAPEFYGNRPTAVNNGDGTITVTHNSTGKLEPPVVYLGTPTGAAPRYEYFPKLYSFDTSSFTYGVYGPLYGSVTYDGSAWVVTCNSYVKPVVTAFSGYVELNFGSSITLANTQLTGVTPSGTVPYLYHLFSPLPNRLRVTVSDFSGAVQNASPTTSMTFQFQSDVMVLLDVTNIGATSFFRPAAIINPEHMVSTGGNFWISGEMLVG